MITKIVLILFYTKLNSKYIINYSTIILKKYKYKLTNKLI